MNDELQELLKKKRELESQIKMLTSGATIRENVKIDRITFAGKYQHGKWALFYKYAHVVNAGCHGVPQPRTRWMPLVNGNTFGEIVNKIPDVIRDLADIYEQAKGEEDNGSDS